MKDQKDQDEAKFGQPLTRRVFLRRAAIVAGGVLASSAVGACAPQGPAPAPTSAPAAAATSAPAAAATTVPTVAAAPTVIVKQRPIVVLQGVDPETLDPQFGESGISAQVYFNTIEGLVQYNRNSDLVPLLCESYQVLDDKVTWRWKLREGVTFWNGEPFNAEAVKFTIERTMDESLRQAGLNDPFPDRTGIEKVVIQDQYTVDTVLKEPNIVMPVFTYFLYMLEPKYYSSHSPQETALAPMGTGPYMVTDWVKGDHLTLEANPNYWRGEPPIKTLIYKPVPEKSTRMNMLLTGEADVVTDLDPDDLPQLEGVAGVRPSIAPGARRTHIGIPTKVERYKDRRVRQALRHAVDWESISNALMGGLPERRPTVLVTGKGWIPSSLQPVAYDPERAQALLSEAGFDMSQPITIYVPVGRYLKGEDVCLAIAGQFRAIGLTADVQMLDWTVFNDKMRSETGLDDLYMLGLGSRFHGPEDVSIVTTGQVWDQTGWIENTENGPKFEAMYRDLTATFDEQQQHEIVAQMLELFEEEAVWINLWLQPAVSGASECTNWEDFGGGGNLNMWPPPPDMPTEYTC